MNVFEIQFEKKKQDDRLCMGHFSICYVDRVLVGLLVYTAYAGQAMVVTHMYM